MYDLFFQPIVKLFQYLYLSIVAGTHNLGLSLILLSVIVNIILRPFSIWASHIQNKERKIQGILAPQIQEIKEKYHGAEQHIELSELYKRYAYNPLYAIRSGTDLFIQLLPLSAAYVMLSSLSILIGQTFLCIQDLSRPDALLHGINILPIIMTLVNFLATLTTERFTRREKMQAIVIAILFLIMLYDAPSALLVYWTSNNIIMLLKNLRPSSFNVRRVLSYEIPSTPFLMATCLIWFVYLYYTSQLFMNVRSVSFTTVSHSVLFCSILFTFTFSWFIVFRHNYLLSEVLTRIFYLFCGISLLLILAFVMISHSTPQKGIFNRRYVLALIALQTIYLSGAILLSFPDLKLQKVTDRLTVGQGTSLFFSALISIIVLSCAFYPAVLYSSDPEFFPSSFYDTIISTLKYGTGLLIFTIFIWSLIPSNFQNLLATIIAFITCVFLINFFILTDYYGEMNAVQINAAALQAGIRSVLKDVLSVILASTILFTCIYKKWIKYLVNGFGLISIALLCISTYYYFTIDEVKASSTQIVPTLPKYHDRLWRLSRKNKNIIGLFLDGFTGDHLLRILEEEPDLRKKLNGFVYFPDTVSVGAWTNLSTAAIYAGPNYNPINLNKKQPNKSLTEKYADALSLLPNIFNEKEYDVVFAGTPMVYKDNTYFYERIPKNILIIPGFHWGEEYVSNWLHWASQKGFSLVEENQQEDISRFSLYLAFFRGSPFTTRTLLYNNGNWRFGIVDRILSIVLKNSFLPSISVMQFMEDFIYADDDEAPTFKMIYSHLSHPPCYLPENGTLPVADPYPETIGQSTLVDGLFPEHYYTEKHIMHFIANFVAVLKKMNVYDNTRIVIVSDHDFSDSWKLHQSGNEYIGNKENGFVWPNALLMFKDFNSSQDLEISDALMSNEDVPSLLMDGIAQVDGIPSLAELANISNKERIRTHCGMTLLFSGMNSNLFNLDAGVFEIKGTMFKKENWTKIR